MTTTKRVVEKRSNYKVYSSFSGSQDNIDQSSPLSSLETDRVKRYGSPSKYLQLPIKIKTFFIKNILNLPIGTADTSDPGGKYRSRNDSWETVEKTRQMFKNNR